MISKFSLHTIRINSFAFDLSILLKYYRVKLNPEMNDRIKINRRAKGWLTESVILTRILAYAYVQALVYNTNKWQSNKARVYSTDS